MILSVLTKFDPRKPEEIPELMYKLCEDVRNIREELAEYIDSPILNCPIFFYDEDEEYTIQYREYLEKSPNAVTTVLPNEEPEYSLSMGEYEVTSEDKRECDMFVCENSPILDDHSEIFSDSNNNDISSDDDAFEDIEYVEASLPDPELVSLETENVEDEEVDLEDIFQIQDIVLREKLLSINRLIANIESLNDNPTPDCVLNSSASIPIFEESDNSLSDNSSPKFETFSDQTEEMRSGSTITHDSLPEYDSFCFEIEPDQERLTSVMKNDIYDDSINDLLLEEVDLFLASDNSILPGIESDGYDSEGDIHFLEELLADDSIPLPENESSNFDHQDNNPSFPRPPPKPPDADAEFEPNSGDVIAALMNNIDEHIDDKCFDPGGEIDVSTNVKVDDYFPFIFVIRIFLPYLIYPAVSPLLLSAGSEDTIFDPDKINILNLKVKLRDNAIVEYTKKLEKAKKERDELKLTLEKYQNSSKSLNTLLEIQENVKSRSDKGYHTVPPPYIRNYIPPKPDLIFIDEQVKSESVDIVSNASSSVVKTVELKVESVDVKTKGVYNTVETKPIRKNNFSLPVIEDWNSDNESEYDCDKRVVRPVWNNSRMVNHKNFDNKITHPHPKRRFVSQAILTKSGKLKTAGTPVNTARPVNTAKSKQLVNYSRPI
uniref:Reverse transcriptase domain-containing protein n=1 Tax=Tanacetum cinerariifolium TaxID=118510 RepID=A0A6L2NM35_TANCI|nr:hypothetical protein [Tanacetum cinerariifolium]